ncbi:amine oxidase [Thiosulfatimonas sediminis]|uniref:Amine oxidase n=1 Tax=Thiosulfatimonas sediminis TaxID=2675054 RepID=A0A6F8PXB0_9GAMM|nr:FAD-dependent oxidoreductase [Thiosulfatimonas sediminis]BBP46792.1 amine oxidase [Thiosulfatimonas sediminis]
MSQNQSSTSINVKSANQSPQKIAVIGSGISGLSSAWFLSQSHQVTLYEKDTKLGGHTNTKTVQVEGRQQAVDTGFIVFNTPNYPHLTAMFKHLNIVTEDTEMSFSASIDGGKVEYSGNNLNTLFAQRRNLLSMAHWKMIGEILRFNKQAKKDLNAAQPTTLSLGEYLETHRFSERMRSHYLLPMAAAIWSCPVKTMMAFPAMSFLRFFENHGLLNIEDRPQWETVTGGSQKYIDAILAEADFQIQLNSPVTSVTKTAEGLLVKSAQGEALYDHVIFASHGDQTWQMLDDSLRTTFECMRHFKYQQNIAYLHRDELLMPQRKLAWASWNYLRDTSSEENNVAVTYWMNLLQNFDLETPILVTLNPLQAPAEDKTYERIVYQHPVFDQAAMDAQVTLQQLQGQHNCWFAGAYTGYGFHEDGLRSGVNIARLWQQPLPWDAADAQAVTA